MVDVNVARTFADEPTSGGVDPVRARFLEALEPGLRERFQGLSPGKQRELLSPHRDRLDEGMLRFQVETDLKRSRSVASRPREATFEGVVRALAGGDASYVGTFAEMLCRSFGTVEDRKLFGAFQQLASQLVGGIVAGEIVLDSYRQGMGDKARNKGKMFTKALRDHGWRPQSEAHIN